MKKITFGEFKSIMNKNLLTKMPRDFDISKLESYEMGPCIEIEFCVDDNKDYQESWMGKLIDKKTVQHVYWFGLTSDGKQAYDFDSFEAFINAKIFRGKNIKEMWDSISIYSLDGCPVEEMLPFYLGINGGEVAKRI